MYGPYGAISRVEVVTKVCVTYRPGTSIFIKTWSSRRSFEFIESGVGMICCGARTGSRHNGFECGKRGRKAAQHYRGQHLLILPLLDK